MVELVRLLWAYSTHKSCWDLNEGFRETMRQRAVSISWFLCSIWPLDLGWNPEDRLMVLS